MRNDSPHPTRHDPKHIPPPPRCIHEQPHHDHTHFNSTSTHQHDFLSLRVLLSFFFPHCGTRRSSAGADQHRLWPGRRREAKAGSVDPSSLLFLPLPPSHLDCKQASSPAASTSAKPHYRAYKQQSIPTSSPSSTSTVRSQVVVVSHVPRTSSSSRCPAEPNPS